MIVMIGFYNELRFVWSKICMKLGLDHEEFTIRFRCPY